MKNIEHRRDISLAGASLLGLTCSEAGNVVNSKSRIASGTNIKSNNGDKKVKEEPENPPEAKEFLQGESKSIGIEKPSETPASPILESTKPMAEARTRIDSGNEAKTPTSVPQPTHCYSTDPLSPHNITISPQCGGGRTDSQEGKTSPSPTGYCGIQCVML